MKIGYRIIFCFSITITLSRCQDSQRIAGYGDTESQGRTLGLLRPLLGLALSSLRPNRGFGGPISNPVYGGGYGFSGSPGVSQYNQLGTGQHGGLSFGIRPNGGGTTSIFNNAGYPSAAGFRPIRYPHGYGGGFNPSYAGYGGLNALSSYQKPFNGQAASGSTSGAGGAQPLNSAQAAQLGHALATSLKPLIAAAAGTSVGSAGANQFSSLLQLLGG